MAAEGRGPVLMPTALATVLQRGRGAMAAEGGQPGSDELPKLGASTRPRRDGRGRSARTNSNALTRSSASTRPRRDGRGRQAAAAMADRMRVLLQRGRGAMAAEGPPKQAEAAQTTQ